MTKTDLFIKLSKPNSEGVSRWVATSEFVEGYKDLKLGNGGSWCRASSSLAKRYIIEFDKTLTPGNSIDAIRLNGFNSNKTFNQAIRGDIKSYYSQQKCVMLGIAGTSENTKIEVDHKNGRKDEERVGDVQSQNYNDFQPLCKAANDAKRQICKTCKDLNKRWDAKNIKGNPYSFYMGDENYTPELKCKGCYQYDPVEYRKVSVKRITEEASLHTTEFIMGKLYPDSK